MIKFGPSGNSNEFFDCGNKYTEQSARWVKSKGLDAFEYSFGRGVNMSDEKAVALSGIFGNEGVEISVHAPYYINFGNPDNEMAKKSVGYVIASAKKAKLLGAKRVIFHPASQGKEDRETVVKRTKERFFSLCDVVYKENLSDILFCPETMGKSAQIGTVEEIADFCKTDKIFLPTIDFGHVNARTCGSLKTTKDYEIILDLLIAELGYERVKNFHTHFSKIEYTSKGEVRHLTFDDEKYGPDFYPLAVALVKKNMFPFVICESDGTQDRDAVIMKEMYLNALSERKSV